jgi:Rap guanine nucleotide exchange factor 4
VESEALLEEEAGIIHNILSQMLRYREEREQNAGQKWKLPPNGQPICLFSGNTTATKTIIRPDDDSEFFDPFSFSKMRKNIDF